MQLTKSCTSQIGSAHITAKVFQEDKPNMSTGSSSGVQFMSAKRLSGRGLGLSLVSSKKMCLYRHFRYCCKEDRISTH